MIFAAATPGWQIAAAIVGLIGGIVGVVTSLAMVVAKLYENHQAPRVTLEKVEGDGNDIFWVTVDNPCLVRATIRSAGLLCGEARCPLSMWVPGETYSGLSRTYKLKAAEGLFVLQPRGIARSRIMRTELADCLSQNGAAMPENVVLRGFCDAVHPGLTRRIARFHPRHWLFSSLRRNARLGGLCVSEQTFHVPEADTRPK